MKKIWIRAGVTVGIDPSAQSEEEIVAEVTKALKQGFFAFEGNCYIPGGCTQDIKKDIEFDI